MRAIITPLGMPSETYTLTDDPTWNEAELGGWGTATVTLPVEPDAHLATRLHHANVELVDVSTCYRGKVVKWDGRVLECEGWYAHYAAKAPRATVYAHNAASDWREHGSEARNKQISVDNESSGFRFVWQEDVAYKSGAFQGSALFIPPCAEARVVFEVERSSSVYEWALQYGVDVDTDLGVSYTTHTAFGTYGTGARTITVTGASDMTAIRFIARNNAARTPAANEYLRIKNLRVYCMGTTTPTPDFIATDIATAIPAEARPGGIEVGVDNVNVLVPFAFDGDAQEADRVARLLDYTNAQFRFEERVAGPAVVYRTPPTAPAYVLDCRSDEVFERIVGGDTSTIYTDVRVMYVDKVGRQRWVDVTAGESNPLKRIGGYRPAIISADTTSASYATQVGEAFMAVYGVPQVRGTIEVVAPHRGVLPSMMGTGVLATLMNSAFGTVNVWVRSADHTGGNSVVLTIDNTPTLDDLLASKVMALGTKKKRFNYVSWIDRRRAG